MTILLIVFENLRGESMEERAKKLEERCIITGYELQTALLRGGLGKLELGNTASLVLLYLASCYNGGVVFPHIKTIAENVGISESGGKKAIAELLEKGCILKSKRHKGNNANVYSITNKVLCLVNTGTNKVPNGYFHDMKSNKKKLNKNHHHEHAGNPESIKSDDVLSSNSSLKHVHVSIEDVPEIIKENKKVLNPCSYWASLNTEARKQVLKDNDKLLQKRSKVVEFRAKKIEEEKKEEEKKKQDRERAKLPLKEQMTREAALDYVRKMVKTGRKRMYSGNSIGAQIIQAFGFDVEEIKAEINSSGSLVTE